MKFKKIKLKNINQFPRHFRRIDRHIPTHTCQLHAVMMSAWVSGSYTSHTLHARGFRYVSRWSRGTRVTSCLCRASSEQQQNRKWRLKTHARNKTPVSAVDVCTASKHRKKIVLPKRLEYLHSNTYFVSLHRTPCRLDQETANAQAMRSNS